MKLLCRLQNSLTKARTPAAPKLGLFVTIINSFHEPLIIATKSFILDVAGVLNQTLISDILASQSWKPVNQYAWQRR